MEDILYKGAIISDAEIINKIILGETAMFEILVRRYNPVLYKIARGYGFNHQDAEDLMQDTHVSAYQSLKQFAFRSSYKTWISKIMIHKCLYKLNHGYAKREQPGSDIIYEDARPMLSNNKIESPEQSSLNKEFTGILERALQEIPVTYKSVFVLREVEGFSVAETAELLNITPINVKVRLNRAKAMLQKQLEQFYTSTNLYEFNLIYCDEMVRRVFDIISSPAK
jgi:RNA polymerase sigma factor (sigma-70 family)